VQKKWIKGTSCSASRLGPNKTILKAVLDALGIVEFIRLSPMEDLLQHPNPKYVSNRVSIPDTHFRWQQRHYPNMSILSPENLFCRKDSLLGPIVGENQKWVFNHLPVALPKRRIGLVFLVSLLEIV
jgi:hypothetical protein